MQERVRLFTYCSGTGATVVESKLQDDINAWLSHTHGRITHVTQSESERQGTAHVTVSVWYIPKEAAHLP
jgi:hypothetical protein